VPKAACFYVLGPEFWPGLGVFPSGIFRGGCEGSLEPVVALQFDDASCALWWAWAVP